MDLWRSVNGMVTVQVVSADTSSLLTALNDAGIPIFHTAKVDDLTVQFSLDRKDYSTVSAIIQKREERVRLKGRMGLYWSAKHFLCRPVLLLGILLMIALTGFIPTRIWFVNVEGNQTLPTKLILEYAAQCGIRFGASRREVRSEKMKNSLLESIPQLQWAGVNTNGCVATISVREKEQGQQLSETSGVSSIVAGCDGVILSCTVTKGSAACNVGQAVKTGELLISGYTDCGISIRATQAAGEVLAQTKHEISAVAPTQYRFRQGNLRQIEKYSLVIGKKRINFFKDSGILDTSCVKMISEKNLTLPGGFELPITLIREVWTYCASSDETVMELAVQQQLSDFSADYLSGQMVAGEILQSSESYLSGDAVLCLEGIYSCREMIGRVQKEEIITPNGKFD